MSSITIEVPIRQSYHAFNRQRWEEILRAPDFASFQGKIETNRHGTVLMMPPPTGGQSRLQGKILIRFSQLLEGELLPECPISTVNGVRAADVGWFSSERFSQIAGQTVFEMAPEICVEVLSPSNTPEEMREKKLLYFEAGAEEVWFCEESGELAFFAKADPHAPMEASRVCPGFPRRILQAP